MAHDPTIEKEKTVKYWNFLIAMSAATIGFSGCAQKQEPVQVPQAAHVFSIEPLSMPVVFSTAADAKNVCDTNLRHVQRLKGEITAI